ncbi:MAG: Nitrogen fixation-related protein [Proteobacteria bacterium]|nr:Nitrogen fixation-related protein [Pseudomonadota bacterium]
MKIALASQNRRTLTAHAGKCRHFFIVDSANPATQASVNLAPGELLHNWSGSGPHPLDGIDVLIAATVGTGVAVKLTKRGMRVLATPERDLQHVVERLLNDTLPIEPIRSEPDARSRPGECLPKVAAPTAPAASGAMGAILGGNAWSHKT